MKGNNKDNRRAGGWVFFLFARGWVCFFLLAWAWAAWWMGDVFRIAYEHSFFAADGTLMHWLIQQPLGWLWLVGRALLTLCRWPLVGGLLVAVLLSAGASLLGYCLHLSCRWRWLQYLPAVGWMCWTASEGLNLYYMGEPGRILATPLLIAGVCGVAAFVVWISRRRSPGNASAAESDVRVGLVSSLLYFIFIIFTFALPVLLLHQRHPYLRPLTRMQVQLLHDDYEGMVRTAHDHADLCNRQAAGFYAIALTRTGHFEDQLFDIKMDFEDVSARGYFGKPHRCLNYHIIDCNYYAGLIRAARHHAVLSLTMDGPSLYTLKYLTKISLIEGDWSLARKYLRILSKAPFEGDFVRRYQPMVQHKDLVQADREMAAVIAAMPPVHVLENMYQTPTYLGYYTSQPYAPTKQAQAWGAMACLYAKRMNDFLRFSQQYAGTMPPRCIAEGLVTQLSKHPELLKYFPQLQMEVDRYRLFLQDAEPYMHDPEAGSDALFQKYKGYYPYYYFFGNLPSKERQEEPMQEFNAGIN
ncbi:MAG: hypothetical protein J6I36_06450 [Bacteroidaceae bacterium]|nr:hypothetical protein [Bacteroidaceae bacterium]